MTDRGVSTVLDAALCLLLVSASVATLVWMPPDTPSSDPDSADETATLVGTTTARVNYTLPAGDTTVERSAQGTLAELLADAAVANATLDGRPLWNGSDAFERRVAAAVERAVADPSVSVSVRATWEPYPDAPLRGTVHAGERPPPDADVHVATLTVPSGAPPTAADAPEAAGYGYRHLASVVAHGTVATLFPPEESRVALRGSRTAATTADRYRRAATLLGTDVAVSGRNGGRANLRLTAALEDRIADEFERRFDSPRAAASAVSVGEVRIVVRTWER